MTTTTARERPALLLDIDGVLNLFPMRLSTQLKGTINEAEGSEIREHTAHRVTLNDGQLQPYLIRIPTDVQSLVAQLSEHFDIHWYTMWNHSANEVFAELADIPTFPVLEVDWTDGLIAMRDADAPEWMRKYVWTAKTPLIEGHVGTRPFVWIDDDSTSTDTLYLENYAEVGQFLLITVEPHSGLTQAVVDEAIDWATNVLPLMEEIAS